MAHPGMMSPNNPVYTTPHGMAPRPPHMQGVMGGYYHQPQQTANGTSPPGSGGSPSPGSEDSNEDVTARQNKRPSPDTSEANALTGTATTTGAGRGKKQKVSKKNKKKKDPNEPHKPVSAYALFFRDTQANIRGQNPNASFGEVSKIVASLWDSLDADNKNVYKKKTEAAKKEYLKQLAAYRASLVSKGGEGENKYPPGAQPPQQGFTPHYAPNYGAGYPGGINPHQQAPSMGMPPHNTIPPQQPSPHTPSPHLNPMMDGASMVNPPMTQAMPPTGAPLMPPQHTPSMGGQMPPQPQPYMAQQASPGLGSPASSIPSASPNPLQASHPAHSPHMYTSQHPPQHSPPQHYTANNNPQQQQQPPQSSPESHQHHNQQHQQQQGTAQPPQTSPHSAHPSPTSSVNSTNTSSPPASNISTTMSVTATECSSSTAQHPAVNTSGHCIRVGCGNRAVPSTEWENEYCSNECVVNHCRDVFSTWVAGNQNSAPGFPAPVK